MSMSDHFVLSAFEKPHKTCQSMFKLSTFLLVEHIQHSHFSYLNFDVHGLGNISADIGGLLGDGDHGDAIESPAAYKHPSGRDKSKKKLSLEPDDLQLSSDEESVPESAGSRMTASI